MCVRVCVCALSTLRLVGVPVFRIHCQRRRLQTPKEVGVVQLGPDLVGLGLLGLDLPGSLAGSLACSLTCSLCPLGSTSWGREGHNHATREPRPSRVGGGSESARSATPRRETGLCALPVRHGILVLRGGGRADFDRVLASGEVGGLAVWALTEVSVCFFSMYLWAATRSRSSFVFKFRSHSQADRDPQWTLFAH